MEIITNKEQLSCPNKPNCVSSVKVDSQHYAEPLRYTIPMESAMRLVIAELKKRPLVKIITEADHYIHATFTTALLRFVDDVEFIFDDKDKVIHFRSKSRVGYYDFGTNRRRMDELKKALAPSLRPPA